MCRAAFQQTPMYIANMGANCPAAVQSLLNGCISVYYTAYTAWISSIRELTNGTPCPSDLSHDESPVWQLGDNDRRTHRQYMKVINICIESVRLLSRLSPREAQRTMYMLRRPRYYSLSSSRFKTQSLSSGGMVPLQLTLGMQHDPLLACFLLMEHLYKSSNVTIPFDANSDNHSNKKVASYTALLNLREYLARKPEFLSDVWNFLYNELISSPVPIPRLSIILDTYVTLVSTVPMHRFLSLSTSSAPAVMLSCRTKLQEILLDLQRVCQGNNTRIHKATSNVYNLLIVSLISTDVILMAHNSGRSDVDDDLSTMLDRSRAPMLSQQLLIRISLALQYGDAHAFYDIIEKTHMTQPHGRNVAPQVNMMFMLQLNDYCKWILLNGTSFDKFRFDDDATISDTLYQYLSPSVALQLIKFTGVPLDVKTKVATHLLNLTLGAEHSVTSYFQDPEIVEFIEQATSILLEKHELKVPLVMPIQIETVAMKTQYDSCGTVSLQLLFQLLYCFTFLQHEPKSPFRIDPRMLPLNLVLKLCDVAGISSLVHDSVTQKLKSHIYKCCPDAYPGQKYRVLKSRERIHSFLDSSLLESKTKMEFSECIQRLVTKPHTDLSGLLTEQAFIEATYHLSESDLISVCAMAFISQPSSSSLYFTYPMLYRDPLVLLKCPLSIWKRRGTRRIAIAILCRLLDIHENELTKQAPNENAFAELLSSRNAIVLTCLIRVAVLSIPSQSGEHKQCGMTCGLIRKLVATHPGLLALLIKQRLNDSEIDWTIQTVPEIVVDLRKLRGILSDRSSLTSAERLTVADYSLRIAIVHGNRYNDIAVSVAQACLLQLQSSFFLILGPIGVPVNALIADGDELDATQVSRKSAFRLLNALQMIKPFQSCLKKDALVNLQIFTNMCKSESAASGLPTAIATRQKSLLRRLLDSVGKVFDSKNVISKTK